MKIHATLTSAIQTNINSIKRLCCVSNKPRSVLDQGVESQLTREGCQAWEIRQQTRAMLMLNPKAGTINQDSTPGQGEEGGTDTHRGTDRAPLPPPPVWDPHLMCWQGFSTLQSPLPMGPAMPKTWPWHTLVGISLKDSWAGQLHQLSFPAFKHSLY